MDLMTTIWKWELNQLWRSCSHKILILCFCRKWYQKHLITWKTICLSSNSFLGIQMGTFSVSINVSFSTNYFEIWRYFTVTLLNMFTIYYDSHEIIEFPQSTMERNLLKVDVSFLKGKKKLNSVVLIVKIIGAYGSSETEIIEYSHGEYGRIRRRANESIGDQF